MTVYNYTTPKIFLIPSEYKGTLRIIYEEECGQHIYTNDGKQVLIFPSNGILILNEEFDGGINNEYFLVDKLGKKKKVSEILEVQEMKPKTPYISVRGSGIISDIIDVNSTKQKEKDITYSDFYLINKNTTDQYDFKKEQKFDSLTKIIVKQCRQQN